jgi:hypothetical protein
MYLLLEDNSIRMYSGIHFKSLGGARDVACLLFIYANTAKLSGHLDRALRINPKHVMSKYPFQPFFDAPNCTTLPAEIPSIFTRNS